MRDGPNKYLICAPSLPAKLTWLGRIPDGPTWQTSQLHYILFLHMLSILVLVFLSCNMHGATLRAKRGSILCATAQVVMRDGPVALAALSLHLSFSGWPYGPTCHFPEMQYVLCANELGVRKTMYFTVLGTANVMRDCSGVK